MGRIVLVDDDEEYAEALGAMLGARRHHVRLAGGVAEARLLIAREVPDVVLCDLSMPIESGDVLLRALAKTYPAVRRVVLSASPRRDLQDLLEEGLAHAVVEKT